MKIKLFALTAMLILLLAACAPADVMPKADDASMEAQPTEVMMEEDASKSMEEDGSMGEKEEVVEDDMQSDSEDMMVTPNWFETEFVNVNNGETFRIADLKGKVVLVETMATWCSNCLKQQNQVKALHEMLGEMNSDLVSVGIGIDINENADVLKNYVEKQGFDWYYAIATAEVANELGNLYGTQFLNPPSTPILLIDRSGEVHVLPFGIKDAQSLKDAILPLLEENM